MSKSKWEKTTWSKIGEGKYNSVYVNEERTHVFKIQNKDLTDPDTLDSPERSVRVWREINPGLPAEIIDSTLGKVWICPYIVGETPTHEEISNAVIEIFSRTGRIVVDAYVCGNFIKSHTGQVICVDIGYTLHLESRQHVLFPAKLSRSKSRISLDYWEGSRDIITKYLSDENLSASIIANTIKALFFIKTKRQNLVNVNFLGQSPELIKQLAKGFDEQDVDNALKALDNAAFPEPVSMPSLKEEGEKLTFNFAAIPAGTTELYFRDNNLGKQTSDEIASLFASIPSSVTLIDLRGNDLDNKTENEWMKILSNLPKTVEKIIIDADFQPKVDLLFQKVRAPMLKPPQELPYLPTISDFAPKRQPHVGTFWTKIEEQGRKHLGHDTEVVEEPSQVNWW